ncbi:MAG: FAD-dependent oxidoreductase [Hyphomicrobiaceae bacterium]
MAARKKAAHEIFPLGHRLDDEAWLGRRPCMPDMVPVIGPTPGKPGLWNAFGHHHLGSRLGLRRARLLAEMMTGETPHTRPEALSDRSLLLSGVRADAWSGPDPTSWSAATTDQGVGCQYVSAWRSGTEAEVCFRQLRHIVDAHQDHAVGDAEDEIDVVTHELDVVAHQQFGESRHADVGSEIDAVMTRAISGQEVDDSIDAITHREHDLVTAGPRRDGVIANRTGDDVGLGIADQDVVAEAASLVSIE